MRLLIKYPSRGRRDLFFSTFDKFHQLSTSGSVIYLVNIDEDDSVMNTDEVKSLIRSYPNTTLTVGQSKNKIDALNRDLDSFSESWDVVVLAADDTVPAVLGYDQIILDEMENHYPDTDGVLHFNDGFWGRRLNTQCILGKKYYQRFGYIYHPSYSYVYCDNDFMTLADLLGKQTYFDKVIIKHEHPDLYGGKTDFVHQKNSEYDSIDKKVFEERKERLFDIDRNRKIKIVHLLLKPLDGPYSDKQKASMEKWSEVKEYFSAYTQLFSFPNRTELSIENCADPTMIRYSQPEDGGPWLSYGHYGAYQAHRRALLEEFNEDLDAIVVIEGDVIFNISPADMAFRLHHALEFAENHQGSLFTFANVGYGLASEASKRDTSVPMGPYTKIDHFITAHCYMVLKKERSNIQHKLRTEKWHAWDIWLYWNYDKRVPIFRTPEPLVFEPEGFSMIDYKTKEINVKL
jgi:hypothetical protein